MESLRQEIRDEMKSIRINKAHVYDVLLRLVDELDGAKPATPAPAPAPVPDPVPAPVPEPKETVQEEPTAEPVKKIVRRVRKKAELSA